MEKASSYLLHFMQLDYWSFRFQIFCKVWHPSQGSLYFITSMVIMYGTTDHDQVTYVLQKVALTGSCVYIYIYIYIYIQYYMIKICIKELRSFFRKIETREKKQKKHIKNLKLILPKSKMWFGLIQTFLATFIN